MPDLIRRTRSAPALVGILLSLLVLLVLAACQTPVPTPSPTVVPTRSPTASASPSPSVTATGSPTATPAPALSLDPPPEADPRRVRVAVAPALDGDGGRITVSVTNLAEGRIDEIVLRWPTELGDTLFLAPFEPSAARVEEFAPPLTESFHWTRWVEGPGEDGEPAGTTTLGYGPMDAGMTLDIPLYVTRRAEGPVAFDLQILAGEALLTLEDGEPAELRVETP